jgi:hypothetical protein
LYVCCLMTRSLALRARRVHLRHGHHPYSGVRASSVQAVRGVRIVRSEDSPGRRERPAEAIIHVRHRDHGEPAVADSDLEIGQQGARRRCAHAPPDIARNRAVGVPLSPRLVCIRPGLFVAGGQSERQLICSSRRRSPNHRPWSRSSPSALGFCQSPALATHS